MSVYADASILVALFTPDLFTDRCHAFLSRTAPVVLVSDFAAAEFASVVARRVRAKELGAAQARLAFTNFDAWVARRGSRLETTTADIGTAEALLRRLDMTLRAPDAINLALAQRIGASLATFDIRLGECARIIGLATAEV